MSKRSEHIAVSTALKIEAVSFVLFCIFTLCAIVALGDLRLSYAGMFGVPALACGTAAVMAEMCREDV